MLELFASQRPPALGPRRAGHPSPAGLTLVSTLRARVLLPPKKSHASKQFSLQPSLTLHTYGSHLGARRRLAARADCGRASLRFYDHTHAHFGVTHAYLDSCRRWNPLCEDERWGERQHDRRRSGAHAAAAEVVKDSCLQRKQPAAPPPLVDEGITRKLLAIVSRRRGL